MAEKSLGIIVPNGLGPISATVNMPALTNALAYQAASYRVQHAPGNTGKVYVGDSTLEPGSGVGMFGYLPELGNADARPYDSLVPWGQISNTVDMSTVFVDTEIPTDGVLITYMEA